MATISEALQIALRHHRAGRLDLAEEIYRRILAVEPEHAEVLHLAGLAAEQRGQHDVAVEHILHAIAIDGRQPQFHSNLGEAYRALGKLEEAIACYQRALELNPGLAPAHNNLGEAWRTLGRLDEAVACYRRALELEPDDVETRNNLGIVLRNQGKLEEALACFRRALELRPDYAKVHNNLGNALTSQRQFDDAVACYRRALELKPDYVEAHYNLGAALQDQWKLDQAVGCYSRAIDLKPDFVEAHNSLGNALASQGKLDEAVACYRRALELKPDYLAALGALVHQLQQMCRWGELKGLSQRMIEFVDKDSENVAAAPVSPSCLLALPTVTTAEQQLRCARQWVDRQLRGKGRSSGRPPCRRASDRKSRIAIGYLSADFHSHATARLIAELFEKHDKNRFAIFGYSYGPDDGSPMRRRLRSAFDRFVDLKDTSFAEAARLIAADEVDILVDLKGYTTDSRTQILTFRPAPIQVNYLGYPGTMGAPFVDYILVDDFVVPMEQQPFFTEKLVHLPGCYQVNDGQRHIASHTPSRAECGLPEEGVVFCCFNNSYKITPDIFGVWMELLKAVPGSVLWLFEGNRFAPANLRREAEVRGVAAERLVFAPYCPPPEHLARHRVADLFLDTFPCNAHTTASDALWAGCPVLTIAGKTFASRVAGSLLRAVGLPELITTSLDEYRDLALRLALAPDLLADLRARLEANRKTCPLFDAGQFARNLEKAYATMWEIYASGDEPRAFAVARDGL